MMKKNPKRRKLSKLDSKTTAATVAAIKFALLHDEPGRGEKAVDLRMKANLIFGEIPEKDHGNLLFALALGAELMAFGLEHPKSGVAIAMKAIATRDEHLGNIAPVGGKAAAKYPDEIILNAFKEYKGGNPEQFYSSAENNIGIKLGYAEVRTLGTRIKSITGITPARWYKSL